MKPWDNPKYQQIVTAHVEQGRLFVRFANGEMTTSVLRNLCPRIDPSMAHDITREHIRLNVHEVMIDYEGEKILVPWDAIRFHTDYAYARHMLEVAHQQVVAIGTIIRNMREGKDMTIEDVSLRTDISLSKIKAIELGDRDVSFASLRKILGAMGFGLKDIAEIYEAKAP